MLINCPACGNRVSKSAINCIRCGHPLEERVYLVRKYHVINYDPEADYRVCEAVFQGSMLRIKFVDYVSEHPSAILIELGFVDEFDRILWKKEISFSSICVDNGDIYETEPAPVDVYDIDWSSVWGVYAEIKSLRNENGACKPEIGKYQIIDRKILKKLRIVKRKYGADSVAVPVISENEWKCRCGRTHEIDENYCSCGCRKNKIEETELDFSDSEVRWWDLSTYIEKRLLEKDTVYDMRLFILGITEDWPELAGLSEIVMKLSFVAGDKEEKMETIRDEVEAFLSEIEWYAIKQGQ
ncbi:MAG: zinc ribbon domain-containing protein [Lachnospiraceae bacterium]|nr:zinc ribbon domain-containing protein [Lachnospiraceae bacterium]